ncbi:N-acetylmuramate alpha-1-phosphate uridylyltransferase MurU [Candidatus Sororendozoicomonas aggregata]|uniref:N-acetylmuramate alpha-1-phosphate uridylyltransferase MurU n=1 Tax=Candidatus Sororendozoicomonas aggregata TaxID=3073239 RepID=UPI002ED03979
MKAMILAAGLGKRLRPLTLTMPKPLVPVLGKPLIVYHIENLAKAGFDDIVINHCWLGEQLLCALGDGARWGVNLSYCAETEPLETGGGVLQALPRLTEHQDTFVVVNGDVYTDYPMKNLRRPLPGQAHLVLVDNPSFKTTGDFACSDGFVSEQGSPLHTFSGISVLSKALFAHCQPGRFSLIPLLRRAMTHQQVSGELYKGHWVDVGTLERLQQLEKQLSTG